MNNSQQVLWLSKQNIESIMDVSPFNWVRYKPESKTWVIFFITKQKSAIRVRRKVNRKQYEF